MVRVLDAKETDAWRLALSRFAKIDVCHLPEYHDAYSTRIAGSKALLWNFEKNGEHLSYPFLLGPVSIKGPQNQIEPTEYFDISGIYGYSGPLSTTDNAQFLQEAWSAFDEWAKQQKIICEFIRFSDFAGNSKWAHSSCKVEINRPVSLAILPTDVEVHFQSLHSKTRNMIRRASKEGLTSRRVNMQDGLQEFRELYLETMDRNQATGFFTYDDTYYRKLLKMAEDEVMLFGVYDGAKMVSAAMCLTHKKYALYHLGASNFAASRIGAGNLVLFEMAKALIEKGVEYFNIGGGRTTAADDPLFGFKKSNGTSVGNFMIGKRVIDQVGYESVAKKWQALHKTDVNTQQLQFYR
jgi:hypothetical protein